ncbi:MAG: hypothetical protein V4598_04270 [Bdellovibrionota bacterium]
MKVIVLTSLFLMTSAAFAKGQVFCKDGGTIYNIEKSGFECQGAILQGDICFSGKAVEAVAILNSDEVHDIFDGTDGEFIQNARAIGAEKITYTSVDQANEWKDQVTIKRCLASWFRN